MRVRVMVRVTVRIRARVKVKVRIRIRVRVREDYFQIGIVSIVNHKTRTLPNDITPSSQSPEFVTVHG